VQVDKVRAGLLKCREGVQISLGKEVRRRATETGQEGMKGQRQGALAQGLVLERASQRG
jgi:hypothetical protein